jgi:hypothetical protein
MTIVNRRTAAAATLLAALLVSERHAAACSCVGVATREYVRGADIVYVGRVIDIRSNPQRFAWPEIEFRLDRTIKGRTEGSRFVLVAAAARGVNCRGFDFVHGKTYLVFASARDSETGRPGTYGVNWCAGTVSLESDEGKQRLRETLQLKP